MKSNSTKCHQVTRSHSIRVACIIFTLFWWQSSGAQSIANIALFYDDEDFPFYDITVSNHTESHIIITKLNLKLLEYTPKGTLLPVNSGKLKPLAGWDVEMPFKRNNYSFTPDAPIKISKDDSGLIRIRLHSIVKDKTKPPQETGLFHFQFQLLLGNQEVLETGELQLGSSLIKKDND